MMRKMVVLGVALVLSFVFCSVSEAANLKKGIIGKWFGDKEQIEFLKDGTVIVSSVVGDYKFIDDNRLRMDIKGIFGSGAMVFEVSIDKGTLTLTDSAGGVSKYFTKAEWEKRVAERKKREALARAEQAKKEAAEKAAREKRIKEKFLFSDLTVLDNETKLMWTRDANIMGVGNKRDKAFEFVRHLNEQKYAGYSDWRLPTKEELETLVSFAERQGYNNNLYELFNKIGFRNFGDGWYWSASIEMGGSRDAYYLLGFDYGGHTTNNYGAMGDLYVLPVRAGQ